MIINAMYSYLAPVMCSIVLGRLFPVHLPVNFIFHVPVQYITSLKITSK